jgi:hypothetical protein
MLQQPTWAGTGSGIHEMLVSRLTYAVVKVLLESSNTTKVNTPVNSCGLVNPAFSISSPRGSDPEGWNPFPLGELSISSADSRSRLVSSHPVFQPLRAHHPVALLLVSAVQRRFCFLASTLGLLPCGFCLAALRLTCTLAHALRQELSDRGQRW